eukprot:CAMPEP_0197185704 /NCGR_PEP_ID=MMETSP1423-20130617/12484_1 /TAXON_ID=476441 /ORGANISM="Pseudo-nitzschia heimii, Strain UNC1101" /LENGTH=492 /DNA_ID=CAMNT_0042636837 /DNA_START=91 /DNA_END=1569 /DNA_ORIENTATION=-
MTIPVDKSSVTDGNFNEVTNENNAKRKCFDLFDGNTDATGYIFLAIGRGMLVMSNILLSSSLLWLASDAAGCFEDEDTDGRACTKKIYGFVPASFITNVSVFSGLVSAILMPLVGAYVDYTSHRKAIGIIGAAFMTIIQGIQIYTTASTWLAMIILQVIAIVTYQFQIVATFAYLPEIATQVGEEQMVHFSTHFTAIQFAAQSFFLLLMAVVGFIFTPSVVLTGQFSQGLNTVTSLLFFGIGWFKYMSPRPPARDLPKDENLFTIGFKQNWNTVKNIQRYFKKGLRWYFLALCFAEASAASMTTISVIYLNDTLKLDPIQVSIFFLVTLVSCVPGAHFGRLITTKSNPNTSWKINLVYLFVVTTGGLFVVENIPKDYSYIFSFFIGIGLGWFYATENLFFSMCLPNGQEAEFAGFFVYCTQILVWLPPLLFTISLESGLEQKYGLIVASTFFLLAAGVLMFAASWDEIVEEASSGLLAIREVGGSRTHSPDL